MSPRKDNIIKDNPLRILGVYSDCPMKEIVANLGKLRAFVKTGKMLDFDSDFTNLLGPVDRSVEAIEKAFNEIALPKDKLQAGLFWFMRHSDNDKAAMECLKVGAPNDAMAIIRRKGNYSSVINMAVLALALKRWDVALYSYSFLLESETRRNALIKSFTDAEGSFTEEDLVEYISNKLFQEFPEAHWVEQIQKESVELGGKTYTFKSRFENSLLLKRLENLCVSAFKKSIESVLKQASAVSKDDAEANLKMAEQVEDKCKYVLKDLRRILGREDKEYIKIADRVANQILENCIYYYNHSADNPRRAQNVIKYTRFAYRTAEGEAAKERAKSNLDYLNDALENQMPESIAEEFHTIDKLVMNYHAMVKNTDCSEQLIHIVEEVYNIIRSIKDKVGGGNKHYMDITSNFVQFVVQEIKIKRNSTSQYRSLIEKERYISTLHWGRQLLDMLTKFDMDEECKKNYDDEFSKVINGLAIVKPVKPFSQTFNLTSKMFPNKAKSSPNRKHIDNARTVYSDILGDKHQKGEKTVTKVILHFVIRVLPKYIISFAVIYCYYLLCIYSHFHWTIKLGCIIPTTIIFWAFAKFLPPKNFDGPIEIDGQYEGGGFGMWNGVGIDVIGNFGKSSSSLLNNPFSDSQNIPHRGYVFLFLWIPLIPVSCISFSQGETHTNNYGATEESKTQYRIYGTCRWSILEVVYLYLFSFSSIAVVIDLLYYLGSFVDSIK